MKWEGRRVGVLLSGAAALAILIFAHLRVLERGRDYAGPLLALDHAFDLVLAGGLVAVATALGLLLLRIFDFQLGEPLDALCFGAATGLGALGTVILALGLLGGLHGPILLGAVVASAILGRRELAGLPGLLARGIGENPLLEGSENPSWWPGLATLVVGLVSLFLLVFGAAPPADWDALMYHLEVPARFLEAGRVHLPTDNLHATVTGLAHMLYLPLLAAKSSAAPALLNGLLALLLGASVLAAGRRFFGPGSGSLALALLWGTPALLLVAVTPRVDVTLALYLFLGHYALLIALETREGRSSDALLWTGLAAALLGLAVGIKYNALAYALALSPLAVWAVSRRRGRDGTVGALLVCGLLGAMAMAPWLLKNLMLVGAPLYPYLTTRIAEPWLNALFPGGSAALAVGPEVLRSLRSVRAPFDLLAVFFDPGRLTVEYEGSFYVANRAFLLLPLWLLFWRNRALSWLVGPALAYLVLVVAPFGQTNLRYLIPAAPALTLGTAWILLEGARRWAPRGSGRWAVLAVCLVALFPVGRAMAVWLGGTAGVGHLVGTVSAQRYLETHHDPGVRIYAPVIRHLNQGLPPDARVLMLFEARGFPLEVPTLQDNKISNWPILAAALEGETSPCLEDAPFDHVLLATGVLGYYERRGLDPERLSWSRFDAFQARCLEPVWQAPGYVLFRRREAPRASSDGPASPEGEAEPEIIRAVFRVPVDDHFKERIEEELARFDVGPEHGDGHARAPVAEMVWFDLGQARRGGQRQTEDHGSGELLGPVLSQRSALERVPGKELRGSDQYR